MFVDDFLDSAISDDSIKKRIASNPRCLDDTCELLVRNVCKETPLDVAIYIKNRHATETCTVLWTMLWPVTTYTVQRQTSTHGLWNNCSMLKPLFIAGPCDFNTYLGYRPKINF